MKEKILTKLMELRSDDLAAMEFAAGRSVEMIKAYCNIAEVPEELLGVSVSLAEMVLNNTGGNAKAKSIREGDVSVTFAEGVSDGDTQEMLRCFQVELDRYRRMDW